jgi:hypothetical protein
LNRQRILPALFFILASNSASAGNSEEVNAGFDFNFGVKVLF